MWAKRRAGKWKGTVHQPTCQLSHRLPTLLAYVASSGLATCHMLTWFALSKRSKRDFFFLFFCSQQGCSELKFMELGLVSIRHYLTLHFKAVRLAGGGVAGALLSSTVIS